MSGRLLRCAIGWITDPIAHSEPENLHIGPDGENVVIDDDDDRETADQQMTLLSCHFAACDGNPREEGPGMADGKFMGRGITRADVAS
jgi:hypothetical protein